MARLDGTRTAPGSSGAELITHVMQCKTDASSLLGIDLLERHTMSTLDVQTLTFHVRVEAKADL